MTRIDNLLIEDGLRAISGPGIRVGFPLDRQKDNACFCMMIRIPLVNGALDGIAFGGHI
jgi:hypothetical protein